MQETWIWPLGWEDPLEARACQPTPVLLPGEFPWTEEPGGLQSRELQRVRLSWVTKDTHIVPRLLSINYKSFFLSKTSSGSCRWSSFSPKCFSFFFPKYMPVEVIPLFCSLIVIERRQRYAYLVFVCKRGLWVAYQCSWIHDHFDLLRA